MIALITIITIIIIAKEIKRYHIGILQKQMKKTNKKKVGRYTILEHVFQISFTISIINEK